MSNNLMIENLSRVVEGTNPLQQELRAELQENLQSKEGASSGGGNFSQMLSESIEKVNLYQNQADQAIKELVAGRNKNIHETMVAIERADTSLKLMMQVRNKVLDAYREIMRMQV